VFEFGGGGAEGGAGDVMWRRGRRRVANRWIIVGGDGKHTPRVRGRGYQRKRQRPKIE
jgi:hypothetical protein